MNHLTNSSKEATPTEVADAWEMRAQMCIDEGDQEDAQDFMQVTHAIRRVLTVLNRLNHRVNTGYDFNADPGHGKAGHGQARLGMERGAPLNPHTNFTSRSNLG